MPLLTWFVLRIGKKKKRLSSAEPDIAKQITLSEFLMCVFRLLTLSFWAVFLLREMLSWICTRGSSTRIVIIVLAKIGSCLFTAQKVHSQTSILSSDSYTTPYTVFAPMSTVIEYIWGSKLHVCLWSAPLLNKQNTASGNRIIPRKVLGKCSAILWCQYIRPFLCT